MPDTVRVVALAGWTCTGKTRFARALATRFSTWQAVVLSQDDYYRDTSHLSRAERTDVNYDEPGSYDLDLFAEHLGVLRAGGSVPDLDYDFRTGARRSTGPLGPTKLVIAEGVFAFWDPRVREAANLRILLEGDLEVLLRRRIARDGAERAYTPAEVRERFENMVIPAQRRYLGAAATVAHLIFGADWDDECVDRAAAVLRGDTFGLLSAQTKGTNP